MATRRARIKAVASLPVRRKQTTSTETKNLDTKDVLGETTQNDGTKNESVAQSSSNASQSPRSNKSPQTRRITSPRDIPKTPQDKIKTPHNLQKKSQASPKTPYSEIGRVRSNEGSSKRKQATPTKICKVENQLAYKKSDNEEESMIDPVSTKGSTTQAATAVRRRIMRPAINISSTKRMKMQDNSKNIDLTNSDYIPKQNDDDKKSKSTVSTPPMMTRFSTKTDSQKVKKIIPIDKADTANLQEVDLTDIDGIVPLQSKSIVEDSEAVKKDIISDVATVNFDPIIPLHSPSKVRPKLRPAPRLAGRRNSYQESASESEEDGRKSAPTPKSINERRKSASACPSDFPATKKKVDASKSRIEYQSTTSMSPVQQTVNSSAQPARNQSSKPRSGGGASIRRRLHNPIGKKDSLTMYDLIFYNPTTNPIVPEIDEMNKPKNEQVSMKQDAGMSEEDVDNPEPADSTKDGEADEEEEPTAMPVPQIKLGPNGEIMLDEKSLVIETTESKTRHLSGSIVRETGGWGANGAGRYTRNARTKDWSDDETVRFYRALATIGTDFSLMMTLFPGRGRRDLKVKFKKEERKNGHLVDKAMYNPMEFNMTQLMEDFKEEQRRKEETEREKERALREEKERLREEKARLKTLKKGFPGKIGASQRCINTILPNRRINKTQPMRTADEIIEQRLETKRKVKAVRRRGHSKKKLLEQQGITTENHMQQQNLDEVLPNQVRVKKPQRISNKSVRKSTETPPTLREIPQAGAVEQESSASVVPPVFSATSAIPKNVEIGSLVVLTSEVPGHSTQKMLQTYITGADGKLTPIALPTSLLGSVMKYVRTERDNKPDKVLDLSNARSVSGGATLTPHVDQSRATDVSNSEPGNSATVEPTSGRRSRHNSYSITSL